MRLRQTHLTRDLSLRRDYTTPRHMTRAKHVHHNHLRRLATESCEKSGPATRRPRAVADHNQPSGYRDHARESMTIFDPSFQHVLGARGSNPKE